MPTDMGIREGTFTVLFGDVEADADGGVPDVGMVGADGAGVGEMASVTVVGGTDGPDAVGGSDVVGWGCEMAAESLRC